MIYILIIGLLILLFMVLRKFKRPKINNLSVVTGAIKSGKSTTGLAFAIIKYNSVKFQWRVKCFINKILKKDLPEEPLFYSNVPVKFKYVQITADLLTRKKRARYKSVFFIDEATLIASNDDYSNLPLVERLEFFNKLFGHATHGGYIFYNTQALGDVSVEIRRCASQVFYIHHIVKWIPFIIVAYVRELVYSEDGLVVNTMEDDAEETLKKVIISKKTFKMFDRYAFSYFTDDLEVEDTIIDGEQLPDLKAREIIGFDGQKRTKEKFYLMEAKKNEKQIQKQQFFFKS